MQFFLAILFVFGACMMMAHQQYRATALQEKRVEYRYLPLDLDSWLKEQQYSAWNVMSDMVNQTSGYCTVGRSEGTPIWEIVDGTPSPTTTPAPFSSPSPGEPEVTFKPVTTPPPSSLVF